MPPEPSHHPRRILIIGSGGAGKSTLARTIAERTGLPLIHLDARYWRAGWVETPKAEWEQTVRELAAGPAWVMDGNYSGTLDLRLAAADTVVFLDLPRIVCLRRIVQRWMRWRGRSRPDIAEGCPEQLPWEFVRWVWSYPTRTRPKVLEKLRAVSHEKRVVVLRSAAEVDSFVESL